MSAMQDFYIAPVSIDAYVARGQAARSQALAQMLRGLPAKLSRFFDHFRSQYAPAAGGKLA